MFNEFDPKKVKSDIKRRKFFNYLYLLITIGIVILELVLIQYIYYISLEYPENIRIILYSIMAILFLISFIYGGYRMHLINLMHVEYGIKIFEILGLPYKLYNHSVIAKYNDHIHFITLNNRLLIFGFTDFPVESRGKPSYPNNHGIFNKTVRGTSLVIFKKEKYVRIPTMDGILEGNAIEYIIPLVLPTLDSDHGFEKVFKKQEKIKPTMEKVISILEEEIKNYVPENFR